MELQEIKSMLDEQGKLVAEARKAVEEGKMDKEKFVKMAEDFDKFEKANAELTKRFEGEQKEKEELKGRIDLLEKQAGRMSFGKESDNEEKTKSFDRYLREKVDDTKSYSFNDMDRKYLRTDLAAEGGVLVPEPIMIELVKRETEISPILENARVITARAKSMSVGVRATIPSVNRVGEGGTSVKSNSTWEKKRIEAYRNDVITPITREELNFAEINMPVEMANDAAEALAYQSNYDFLNGDGVSKSQGIMVSGDVSSINSGVADNIIVDNFFTLQKKSSIKDIYARVGKFYMNSNTIFTIAIEKNGLGQYVWVRDAAASLPNTIAGKPYASTPDMPDIAPNAYPVFFGDLRKAYYILRYSGTELIVDPYSSKGTGIIEYMWVEFIGGKIALAEAIVKLKVSA